MPKVTGYHFHPSLSNFIYVRKKHYCPHCDTRMKHETAVEVLRPFNYTWGIRSGKLVHYSNLTSEWHYPVLQCPNCGCIMTIHQMKDHENTIFTRIGNFFRKIFSVSMVLVGIAFFVGLILSMVSNAYAEGYVSQNVWGVLQKVIPDIVWDYVK